MPITPPVSIYRLRNLGLPTITSLDDLANETRLSPELIRYLTFRTKHLYRVFNVPKKSGGSRVIAQPSRELKAVQGWILRHILDKLASSSHSKGFERGQSILANASPHVGSSYVLTMDLEDFFPSITGKQVFGVYASIGYDRNICHALTNLCLYDGRLPQGAPTSPKLANLVCNKLDARIYGYAGPKGIVFTRYADDLTLSAQTHQKINRAKRFLPIILADEGFSINHSKTKICGTRQKREITGLVVSNNSAGIGREKLRELRAKIHHLFVGHSAEYSHINGWMAFVQSVDKKSHKRLCGYITKMRKKYPDSTAVTEVVLTGDQIIPEAV